MTNNLQEQYQQYKNRKEFNNQFFETLSPILIEMLNNDILSFNDYKTDYILINLFINDIEEYNDHYISLFVDIEITDNCGGWDKTVEGLLITVPTDFFNNIEKYKTMSQNILKEREIKQIEDCIENCKENISRNEALIREKSEELEKLKGE